MCIYLVISFSCCCYLFLSFYMCSPFLSLLYVSICFHLSEWVTSGPIDQSDQSRWKPPFWGVHPICPWRMWVSTFTMGPVYLRQLQHLWFSISVAGQRQEISQAGRQAADTISTPCPLHTSLRDCLNQNGAQTCFNLKGPKNASI